MLLFEMMKKKLEEKEFEEFVKSHTFTAPAEEDERKKPETVEEMEKRIVETVDGLILATRTAFTADLLDNIQKPEDVVTHTHNVLSAFLIRTLGWEEEKAKKHIRETGARMPDFAEFLLTALLKTSFATIKRSDSHGHGGDTGSRERD